MSADYRLFVNAERTVLVRVWTNGTVDPPVFCEEEKV